MTETPASAVTFDCATLRAVAVQQANPAWFVSLPAPLVQRARASALGSRMLAWVLAEGIAPALFAEPAWKMPANADWLFWPKSALDEVALDFAALALSAPIRATVSPVYRSNGRPPERHARDAKPRQPARPFRF